LLRLADMGLPAWLASQVIDGLRKRRGEGAHIVRHDGDFMSLLQARGRFADDPPVRPALAARPEGHLERRLAHEVLIPLRVAAVEHDENLALPFPREASKRVEQSLARLFAKSGYLQA